MVYDIMGLSSSSAKATAGNETSPCPTVRVTRSSPNKKIVFSMWSRASYRLFIFLDNGNGHRLR